MPGLRASGHVFHLLNAMRGMAYKQRVRYAQMFLGFVGILVVSLLGVPDVDLFGRILYFDKVAPN